MRKLIELLSATALAIGLMAGAAAADTVTCGSISNTGPGSNNTVTCVDKNNVQVTCNNNLVVENTNNQNSNSGDAFTTDNTNSGSSTSGNSSNNNTVVVDLNASCAPVASTVNAPSTPAAPAPAPAGGKGAAVAAAPAKPVSLPETGSNTAQKLGTEGLVALVATLGLSQIALSAYRRLALR